MMRLSFYLLYGARNLWRSRRWSAFAILSVAAGVATLVALRSLGLAIEDSLTRNVRESNKGDLTLVTGGSTFFSGFAALEDPQVFEGTQRQRIVDWAQSRGATLSEYTATVLQVTSLSADNTAGRPTFVTALLIDPDNYPPTHTIRASQPDDAPLADLFLGGDEIVISENLASAQDIAVGDRVRLSGTEREFVVRGIVPTYYEAGLRELFSAFFGFVYIDRAHAESLSITPHANRISLALPGAPTYADILQAGDELHQIVTYGGGYFAIITVPRLVDQNRQIADLIGRLVVVMGLGAMLLGGVGIINTMLVMVRRRTEEIAALKTFGLKARQVALMFIAEALILGALGSAIGAVFGVALSYLTNIYGETFIQQRLVFQVYPQAIGFGIVLGVMVTGVFGVLPVLTASHVRPGIILRPNETHIPRAGVWQSLIALALIVVALGLITGQIIGPFPSWWNGPGPSAMGLIGVAAALTILALLVGLLWIVVWLIGRLPAFGLVDLRLALRNMTTRRVRTATTLLALSAGMFALSSITFFGAGVREILSLTLTETFGGNVVILPLLPSSIAQPLIDARLDTIEGIEYRTRLMNYDGRIVQIDDQSLREEDVRIDRRALSEQIAEAYNRGAYDEAAVLQAQMDQLFSHYVSVFARETDNPSISARGLIAGRQLTPEDAGQRVAVLLLEDRWASLGVQIGSTVLIAINGQEEAFEIVGLLEDADIPSGNLGDITIPAGVVQSAPDNQLNVAQVDEEHLNQALLDISAIPLVFAIDVTFIDGILSRFIEQFSALPLLVGILSLGAAAVIMANTVALSTLERRRQIGILKAVGLKGRRVLWIMLLENLMISLLGGVLGIGLSGIGVWVMTQLGLQEASLIPDETLPVAIALVAVAVIIGALATILSANMAVRERVLNVLRYE